MEPKIYEKEAMPIAGVSGSGDVTGEVWEAYVKLEKISPLANMIDKAGYEVRTYPGDKGPGEVHIGMSVRDRNVPAEYKMLALPASLYAKFEIYPAGGYESSNEEMERWLSDNSEKYRQKYIGDKAYGIEVYDERFKGNNNPESVVPVLVPIEPVE